MNILDLQDKLKNFSQDQLVREMQMPTGQMPQFLLLSEITRRQKMKNDYAQQQGREQSTVAQDAINAAGMPQGEAQQLAGTMAPQTDMAGNTGAMPQQMMPQAPQPVQGMAGGGIVALAPGGPIESAPRTFVRNGMIIVVDDEGREIPYGYAPVSDDYLTLPSQTELDQRYRGGARDAARPLDRMRAGMDAPSIGDVPAIGADTALGAPRAASGLDAPFTNRFDRGLPSIPQEDYLTLPSQADLDQRYSDELFGVDQMRAGMDAPSIGGVPAIASDPALGAPRAAPRMPVPREAPMQDRFDPMQGAPAPGSIPDMLPVMTAQPFPIVGQGLEGIVPPPAAVPREAPASIPAYDPFADRFDQTHGVPAGFEPPLTPEQRLAISSMGMANPNPPSAGGEASRGPILAPAAVPGVTDRPLVSDIDLIGSDIDGAPESLLPPGTVDPGAPGGGGPGGGGPGGGGPGGGGGIAGAAGAPSSFEQELIKMLAAREKRATQDKWLALAQAGMQLMSSNQPTFGGALGEAGSAGLAALREVAPSAEADRLELLGQIEQSRLARQAMAARAAGGGGGGRGPTLSQLNAYAKYTADTLAALAGEEGPASRIASLVDQGRNQEALAIQEAVAEDAAARRAYNDAIRGGGSATSGGDPNFLDASANEE